MTEFLISITAMVVISLLLHLWKKDGEETDETEIDNEKDENVAEEVDTFKLVIESLTKLGCQYYVDKDSGYIRFMFQGGFFTIETSKEDWTIKIYYWRWLEHDIEDIDGYADLRRIVNETNQFANVVTIYTIDDDENKVVLHSHKRILFISQIPHREKYLKTTLESFFYTRSYLSNEFLKTRTGVTEK